MHRPALVVLIALSLAGCARTPPSASVSAQPATPRPTTSPSGLVSQVESPSSSTSSPEPELTGAELAALVDGAALRAHLEALERIAREPSAGGNRATGTIGFESSAAYAGGMLGEAGYVVQRLEIDAGGVPSENLIADLAGAGNGVIVVGAHLDSVLAGPGINDNGSGVATLLVIAQGVAALPAPTRTIRFAFWGAEEGGLFGSAAYVDSLGAEERAEIVAYLNFDMLASPNAVRFVYAEPGAAPGSSDLTEAFATYFEAAGLPWEPIDLSGDSDHGPFTVAGIPTGGLFSGGSEPVTDAQAATFGAIAGEPADPCSHRACDTIDNVDLTTLEQMADAIAHVLVTLATTD